MTDPPPETIYLPADDKSAYMRCFDGKESLWVFAYGSLIWHPGFEASDRKRADLHGFHRSFCLISNHYRGTPECTGLVLALDEGGVCHGVALRAESAQVALAAEHLWDREMVSYAYLPVLINVDTPDGAVQALTFVMNRDHVQYAGKLDDAAIIARILIAKGKGGTNVDYLLQTAEHLREWQIADDHVERLAAQVTAHLADNA